MALINEIPQTVEQYYNKDVFTIVPFPSFVSQSHMYFLLQFQFEWWTEKKTIAH